MYEKIKNAYGKSIEKIKKFFNHIRNQELLKKIVNDIFQGIENNHEKSSWVNIAELITNILGFTAYCVISPVLAEYQRVKGIRIFSIIAIIFIITVIIWELLCLAGCKKLKSLVKYCYGFGKKVAFFCQKYLAPVVKVLDFFFSIFIILLVFICELACRTFNYLKDKTNRLVNKRSWMKKWGLLFLAVIGFVSLYFIPDVTYCTSVVENYGIPKAAGEKLEKDEKGKYAAYWKIEDYPLRNFMVLTYVEPYDQLEVMKQNSTAYGMLFFEPTARIEIYYERNREKYHSLNQHAFEVAKENKFREPVEISYYSSNDKLILKLEKNEYGRFDITHYSYVDMPQLLNSTLLYTQNEEVTENSMASQQIEVTYNAEGLPETRRLSPYIYNANGINGEYYVYDQNQRLTTLYYLDINGEYVCNKQGIMMIDFQYENNGNLHSIRYYSGEDREKKTEGYQGIFCERFSYDSYGNLKERSQRNRNENLCSDVNGVCVYRYNYDYDTDSALVKEEFLGFDGEPVRDNSFHSTLVEFEMLEGIRKRELVVSIDAIGSSVMAIDKETQNEQNQTVLELDYKQQNIISLESVQSDAVTAMSQSDILNKQFVPVFTPQDNDQIGQDKSGKSDDIMARSQSDKQNKQSGPVFALQDNDRMEQEKNTKDENNTEIHLDEEADIIRNYVSIHYIIDKNGCIDKKSYYDSMDRLAACEEGYATVCYEYDRQKRITHRRYFDKDNLSYYINGDYTVVRTNYESNQNDDVKSIEYLDVDENLVQNRKLGYAYVEYTREPEDKNKIICKKYFDENNEPVRLPGLGYAKVEEYYDERNFLIWEAYYDEEDGKTCRVDYGVAEIWYEYEDSGNRIRELYKDVEKQLVNRSDTGYAAVYWKYEGGQKIDCHYEGNQNQGLRAAVNRKTGIAGIKYTYEGGEKVKEEYYDTAGMPSFRTDIGCVSKVFEYNDRGKICAESYYGLDGEAVLRKDTGYAMVAYQDNEYGQRVSVRYYDTNKQLVISAEDHCAGYNYEYDNQGNREYVKYIGLDGKLMTRRDLGYAQVHYRYDADGNIIEARYLDTEGELAVRKESGYAYYTSEYDNNGNWIESCYYIAEDTPVLRQDEGYFRIENEYYDDGNLKSQKFYGIDGEQCVISTKYGCAGFRYEYNDIYDNEFDFEYEREERGVKKITTYIGLDGKPMVRRDLGYAKVVSVYDIVDNEISAIFYDAEGNITVRKEGGYAAFRNVYENGKWMKCQYYDVDKKLVPRSDTGYAVIINEYDEYGQRIRENYYNENNEPTISRKHYCAGLQIEYDEKGNKIHVKYLDTGGKIMVRRDLGYAQAEMGYDSVGNQISAAYFDTKGQPVVWKEGGYASYRSEYDNVKWIETRYYDTKGRLTLCDKGYAVIKNEYDEYGQRILQTYYDTSDTLKPIISEEYHCAGFQFEYDEMGNEVYTGYLDLDGNLMARRDLGYAQVIKQYNCIGNVEQVEYYDIWGNPAVDKEGGYSCYKNYYDKKGRREKIEYYIKRNERNRINIAYGESERTLENGKDNIDKTNQEGELVLRKDTGYAIVKYDYDAFGQEKKCSYCGIDGEPVISTKYLCAGFEYAYDERGNKTDIYYLGLKNERIVRSDLGVAHIQRKYDIWGNLRREYYYNIDGITTYMNYGYAAYKNIFKNGKVVETQYFDKEGNLVIHGENGYAIVQYEYDAFGQCISEFYYGTDYQPIISQEYYCAGCQYEYDEMGNRIERRYVDTEGNFIVRSDLGYASVYSEYDERGNEIRVFYYDTENNPAQKKDSGNASCEYIYDDRGKCIEWRYFDRLGNLMLCSDTGYAILQYEYNDYGQCIGEYYYDTERERIFNKDYQCAGRQFGYDERGNQTEFCCIGLDGKPMIWKWGYAQSKYEYDNFNNKTKEIYLDTEGNPIIRQALGYAEIQWKYNEAGKKELEAYFDENGQSVACKEGGYASCKFYYDDEAQWEERQYFDTEDNLILRSDEGYAVIRYFYNEYGQCIAVDYLGENRKRVINTKKYYSEVSYEYDERGNNIYIWYRNTKGEVEECKDTGIAMEYMIYDEYGNMIEREYYRVNPEDPGYMKREIHKDKGYARVEYVYEGNVWMGTKYYGTEKNLIMPQEIGYAVYKREYDDIWQVSYEAYYDANEDLIREHIL